MWDRIKAMLTENLNLKLLSFAFALVLYSLVHGGQDSRGSNLRQSRGEPSARERRQGLHRHDPA